MRCTRFCITLSHDCHNRYTVVVIVLFGSSLLHDTAVMTCAAWPHPDCSLVGLVLSRSPDHAATKPAWMSFVQTLVTSQLEGCAAGGRRAGAGGRPQLTPGSFPPLRPCLPACNPPRLLLSCPCINRAWLAPWLIASEYKSSSRTVTRCVIFWPKNVGQTDRSRGCYSWTAFC